MNSKLEEEIYNDIEDTMLKILSHECSDRVLYQMKRDRLENIYNYIVTELVYEIIEQEIFEFIFNNMIDNCKPLVEPPPALPPRRENDLNISTESEAASLLIAEEEEEMEKETSFKCTSPVKRKRTSDFNDTNTILLVSPPSSFNDNQEKCNLIFINTILGKN
jgi:hypothetical protein